MTPELSACNCLQAIEVYTPTMPWVCVCVSVSGSEDGSVRLIGGDGRQGVVEVAYNGRWGTICDDGEWDIHDASIVCNQLGFPGPIASIHDQWALYFLCCFSYSGVPIWRYGAENGIIIKITSMGKFQASVLVAFPVPGLLRLLLWQRRIDFDYRPTATAHNKSVHACAKWMTIVSSQCL